MPSNKRDDENWKYQKLLEFRSEVEKNSLVKHWFREGDLVGTLITSLGNALQTTPGIGWVRGDQAVDPIILEKLREENLKLKADIENSQRGKNAHLFKAGDKKTKLTYQNMRQFPRTKKELAISWNEIFSFIGPDLFAAKFDTQFDTLVRSLIATKEMVTGSEISEAEEGCNKIKMQMIALGLIYESGKAMRQNGAYGSFWELTAYGKKFISELIAEKK